VKVADSAAGGKIFLAGFRALSLLLFLASAASNAHFTQ
jgi:hypothetical protein